MRLICPYCGERDRREFTYKGAAVGLLRPKTTDWGADWDEYLHIRDNPAGVTQELWQHDPCGAWIVVTRNTVTHVVIATRALAEGAA